MNPEAASWREGSARLEPFLSARGRAARMVEGIRVWGERAARAGALDATMGVITAPPDWTIAGLPDVRDAFAAWEPGEVFPYAPVAGTTAFRQAWRRWILRKAAGRTAATGDPLSGPGEGPLADRLTLPVATPGVTGALATVAHLVLDPGDTVLVPDRRWDGYDSTFGTVSGAHLDPVRLLDGDAWDLGAWEAKLLAAADRGGRTVCVVNFPHNPTGYVPAEAEAEAFASLVIHAAERSRAGVVVVCDDAYEGYVYTDRPRGSIFYRLVGRHPRLLPIKCDGITKELLFWGGRLGAVTTAFPPEWDAGARTRAEAVWENKLSAVIRGFVSSASTPVQTLAARLLADPERLLAARGPIFESLAARRETCVRALETDAARTAFRADPFHGGLFALLNLRRGDAVPAAERLLAERSIGVVPYHDPSIGLNALRVTYATVPEPRVGELIAAAAAVVN